MGKVVVVGAGAVGLACAYHLRRRGEEVVVVDKGRPGTGSSAGNLGCIVPSLTEPVPAPGLVWTSLRWMLRKDSPLYIKPSSLPGLAGWLWRFYQHCNLKDREFGIKALYHLGRRTFELFDEIEAEGVHFEHHRKGLLYVCRDPATLPGMRKGLEHRNQFSNARLVSLNKHDLHDLEPGLDGEVGAGVLIEGQRHVRPESFCSGLTAALERMGAVVRSGVKVTGVRRERGRAVAAITSEGEITADRILITTGAEVVPNALNCRIPLQPAKGYSVTFAQPSVDLKHPLMLVDSKVMVVPYKGHLRIGGTLELSGHGTAIDPHRIASIRRGAARAFKRSLHGSTEVEWAGMRPLTPDGLPVMGRLPDCENLYIAVGHSVFGVTLSLATGSIMADLMCLGRTDVDLAAFRPTRFQEGKGSRAASY